LYCKDCVKKLHFGSWEEKEEAAKDIEMLAKPEVKVRKLMTELWVVPVLVLMALSVVASWRRVGVKASIKLENGRYMKVFRFLMFLVHFVQQSQCSTIAYIVSYKL